MTYPTLSVQVAFGDDPLATSWTWTDVTSYVKRVRVVLGRDRELDDFEPGRAIIVFDNTDRRFDPEHATGPYYGDLLPSKRVRIRATHAAVTYTLFHGYVDDWPQDYSGAWTSDVVVPCTDAFGQLARATLPSSVYAAEVMADTPWAWWRFQEGRGQYVSDSSGNNRRLTFTAALGDLGNLNLVPSPVADKSSVMYRRKDIPGSDYYFFIEGFPRLPGTGDFSIEFFAYSDTFDNYTYKELDSFHESYSGWKIRLGLDNGTYPMRAGVGTETDYRRSNVDCAWDSQTHHFVVKVVSGTITLYVDGAVVATTGVGSTPLVPDVWEWIIDTPGSSAGTGTDLPALTRGMGEIAIYPAGLTNARVTAHHDAAYLPWDGDTTGARIDRALAAIGWPSALASTAAGLTELGPAHLDSANALAYLKATANAEQGQLFCDMANLGDVTFLDRHERLTATRSTTPQYVYSDEDTTGVIHYETIDLKRDGRDVINEVVVKWAGGEATVQDAASITTYGLKSLSIDTELGSRIEAENLGEWIIGRYSVPVARCRGLSIDAATNADTMTAALDSRINDRVSIRRLPNMTGSPIELDVIVEGIEHNIDNGVNTWITTLRTSQADAGPWFVWDTAEWDTDTRWAW